MARGVATVLLLVAAAMASAGFADAYRCDRRPKDVKDPPSPVNGRFKLEFSGRDNFYVPDHVYRVKLLGARHGPGNKNMFRVFTIFLEPESFWGDSGAQPVGNLSTGGDSLVTFGECANTIRQTSGLLKDAVEVLWRAPPTGSGCVFFRATVVEDSSKWYMDDESLTLHLCEEQQMNHNRQPAVQDPCCACEEAKYEMTFEGLWSRHSHPKDFPKNWDTRFSDVIGASHAANYSFWQYLGIASPGLRQVAENGTTRTLEKELKDNSQHIRTIIKARGIGYPNVTGKTFAVFRVDRDHHLMSIVSHIDPSPDWFVGLSGLELCQTNCSWVENIQFDLYPWDAGTNDGITYYSKGTQTWAEPIRQITSSYPNNKDSPFYDPTATEMKPMARVYLTRQRLYEKFACTPDAYHNNKNSDCATTPFSPSGPCSVTCGRGVRLQQRRYLNPVRANEAFCNETLTRRDICSRPACPNNLQYEAVTDDPRCETTEWGEWSPCPSCGGYQTRERYYKHEDYFKYCNALSNPPLLQQTLSCQPDPGCNYPETVEPDNIPPHCELTNWSEWSPCSVTCGNGTRIRSRQLVARDPEMRMMGAMSRRRDDGFADSDEELEELAAAGAGEGADSDCDHYKLMQEMHCSGTHDNCDLTASLTLEEAKRICMEPKEEGPCRMQEQHWYFDANSESCRPFNYGGCRGNQNNFATRELCEEVCVHIRVLTDSTIRSPPSANLTLETPPPDYDYEKPVNCRVSRWSQWSECSVTCGKGYKYKSRKIMVHPQNGGKTCPKLRKKHHCNRKPCMDDDFENEMPSDENPTWGEARRIKSIPGVDCKLSEWSPWSQCTRSCGSDRRRLRTRTIEVPATPGGMPCDRRIEYTYCASIPCPTIGQ